jgi:chromosomal replication initiation ATPase DnaA
VTRQIPLKLEPHPDYAAADLLQSEANRAALALVRSWPEWALPTAVIWGPAGSGKTHLAHIWAERAGASLIDADDLSKLDLKTLPQNPHIALDFEAVDVPRPDERLMFHLLNMIREKRGALLIVARTAPSRWGIALPDLESRLKALPSAEVSPPDDGLFAAVLAKQFSDRQLVVDRETVEYMAARSERSFAAARRLVARIDQAALASRRLIGKRLAGEVIEALERESGNAGSGPAS